MDSVQLQDNTLVLAMKKNGEIVYHKFLLVGDGKEDMKKAQKTVLELYLQEISTLLELD